MFLVTKKRHVNKIYSMLRNIVNPCKMSTYLLVKILYIMILTIEVSPCITREQPIVRIILTSIQFSHCMITDLKISNTP